MNPKKSLGQNWLVDQDSLLAILECAELNHSNLIVEIGPGTGNLTKLLIQKVNKVIAVEIDQTLVQHLTKLKLENLELINQDIRSFDFNKINSPYKIVANIPYYLTSRLIRLISETSNRADLVVLLVQKEIAERLNATKGKYSILGLSAQIFWDVRLGPIILRDKFEPVPKVDSQVVILKNNHLEYSDEIKKLLWLIKIGFRSKRKTLINNLKASNLGIDKIHHFYEINKINLMARPSDLSLSDWSELSKLIKN